MTRRVLALIGAAAFVVLVVIGIAGTYSTSSTVGSLTDQLNEAKARDNFRAGQLDKQQDQLRDQAAALRQLSDTAAVTRDLAVAFAHLSSSDPAVREQGRVEVQAAADRATAEPSPPTSQGSAAGTAPPASSSTTTTSTTARPLLTIPPVTLPPVTLPPVTLPPLLRPRSAAAPSPVGVLAACLLLIALTAATTTWWSHRRHHIPDATRGDPDAAVR